MQSGERRVFQYKFTVTALNVAPPPTAHPHAPSVQASDYATEWDRAQDVCNDFVAP